jgi:hypothetical protein
MKNQIKGSQIVIGSSRDILLKHKDPKAETHSSFLGKSYVLSQVNQDILEIVKVLCENGYKVKTLCKGVSDFFGGWIALSPVFSEKSRELGAVNEYVTVPDSFSLSLGPGGNPVFNWLNNASEKPRDAFVQVGKKIYLNNDYYPFNIDKKTHKGYTARMEWLIAPENPSSSHMSRSSYDKFISKLESVLEPSPLGEGGKTIVFRDFILASDAIRKKIKPSTEEFGSEIYFLRPISAGDKKDIISENKRQHIDYHVNGVDLAGHSVILADPSFYKMNSDVFEELQRKHPVKLVFVDESETQSVPANFLVLPDGKVLMPAGAKKTQKTLEEEIGSENVLVTRKRLPHLLKSGYGVRCISNTLAYYI